MAATVYQQPVELSENSLQNLRNRLPPHPVCTPWDSRLWKRFHKIFYESYTCHLAVLQLPCSKQARGTSSKHITKPFSQPDVPGCIRRKNKEISFMMIHFEYPELLYNESRRVQRVSSALRTRELTSLCVTHLFKLLKMDDLHAGMQRLW